MPALLTRVSIRPNCATPAAITRSGVAGGGDGARGGDDGVAELAVGVDDAGAEALRGTGDDCDLLVLSVHDDLFREDEYLARSVTSRPVNYLLRTLRWRPAEVNG